MNAKKPPPIKVIKKYASSSSRMYAAVQVWHAFIPCIVIIFDIGLQSFDIEFIVLAANTVIEMECLG